MTEYLIAFNGEWVPDHTVEELREKSKALRPLVAEMKAAGVLIFTGGLDDAAPVFSVDASSGTPLFTDGPFVESKEHLGGFAVVDVADEEAARLWAERSRRPAVGRRRCDASRSGCNFQRFLNGVGGRSYCEAPLRVLVERTLAHGASYCVIAVEIRVLLSASKRDLQEPTALSILAILGPYTGLKFSYAARIVIFGDANCD